MTGRQALLEINRMTCRGEVERLMHASTSPTVRGVCSWRLSRVPQRIADWAETMDALGQPATPFVKSTPKRHVRPATSSVVPLGKRVGIGQMATAH